MKSLLFCISFVLFLAPTTVSCMQAANPDDRTDVGVVANDLAGLTIVVTGARAAGTGAAAAARTSGAEAKASHAPAGFLGMPSRHKPTSSMSTEYEEPFIEAVKTGDSKAVSTFFDILAITSFTAIELFLESMAKHSKFYTGILNFALHQSEKDNLEFLKYLHALGVKVKGLENIMVQSPGKHNTEVLTAWVKDYSPETIEWLIANDNCILLPDAKSPQSNKISVNRQIICLTKTLRTHPNYTDVTDPAKLVHRKAMADRIITLYTAKWAALS